MLDLRYHSPCLMA